MIEAQARRVGRGVEVVPQHGAQPRVLVQGQLALATEGEEAHQPRVRGLVGRLLDQEALERDARLGVGPPRLGEQRGLGEQAQERRAQSLPARGGPVLVAVLGQQLAPVEGQRRRAVRRVVRAAGGGGGGLEHGHVDQEAAVGLEGEQVPLQEEGGRAGGHVCGRGQGPTGRVERLVKVVGGGGRVEIGPEQVHDPVTVQVVSGGERQQLDQAAPLVQAPRGGRHHVPADGDAEAAE